ncbi:MAG TPA: T9SS type A sorting domain-containing protein [Chitinophagales bacterium]|nr:T9SS type A sorting domain-containing protein [Chitinophagales bacterium]
MKTIKGFLLSATIVFLAAQISLAQWTIDSVNSAGLYIFSTATNSKAVFTNGCEWNVFDATTLNHTWGNLSLSRAMIKTVSYGDKAYFGGGKYGYFADPQYTRNVDVYDASTDSWSTLLLSKAREVGGAGAAGNKIVFAGGTGRSDISGPVYMYGTADIFDATTGARISGKLSKARSNISVGACGNKIVFAGGWYWDFNYNVLQSNAIDIYDAVTNVWSKTTLSIRRENISVAVVGDKIIFAGGTGGTYGQPVTNVDIYDVTNNAWSTTNLPTARYGMKSVVIGDNAYFAGGAFDPVQNEVNIYNTQSNSWSTIYLPTSLSGFSMSVINDKIYFAGGFSSSTNSYSDLVQIYDPATSTWDVAYLSVPRRDITALTCTNKGFFAGGIASAGGSKRVDIVSISSPIADFTASSAVITAGGTVNFTDLSTNNPTSWSWVFNGGTPSTSTEQNPAGIQYNTTGTFDVTLTASNAQGSSTITKVGYITVNTPPCVTPTGFSTTDITSASATFNWSAVSGATKYKVTWKISGNNPWTTTTITSSTKTVTGLTPNTSYIWKVRTICGQGMVSDFSATQSFTTASGKMGTTLQTSAISIYPNPVSDHFRISNAGEMQLPMTCSVYDMYGQLVKEFRISSYQQWMDVSDLDGGNYFVRLVDAQNNVAGLKISKQ